MSLRAEDFTVFAAKVVEHINAYTVPQYGDKGDDPATNYASAECIAQIRKYAARYGKNSRPGQDKLDLIKIAHYAQLAHDLLDKEAIDENRQ